MVRLKVLSIERIVREFRGFNSNMVRLKVCSIPFLALITSLFQFQYGSIKSQFCLVHLTQPLVFQFQYGSIKSISPSINPIVLDFVSIPIWFD